MLSFALNVVVPTHLITSIVPYGTNVTPSANNINLKILMHKWRKQMLICCKIWITHVKVDLKEK